MLLERTALALALLAAPLAAQSPKAVGPFISSPRRALTAPELRGAPEEWISRSLGWAGAIFDAFPPSLPEQPVRRAALIRLDDILHIESAPKMPLVRDFYHARMEKAVREIEQSRTTEGMRIWKLYNHGFFVRTPSVSFAFDIVPGPPGIQAFALPADLMERLAAQADALFLSHPHNDHVNRDVVRLFLARNKPVLAPEGLWVNEPEFARKLAYPKRSASEVHDIPVRGGERVLKLTAYPGHQGAAPINNVNLVVTPEGFAVIHTGDQSGDEGPGSDFDWIARIGHDRPVDVALPNCWTNDIQRVLRGIDPRLVITGHENELAHEVPHREDYTQTYNHLYGSPYPVLVMTWGESFWYRR